MKIPPALVDAMRDSHGVQNTYVLVILNVREHTSAAMRFTILDTKTHAPSQNTKLSADMMDSAKTYARTLGWREADTTITALGPMTAQLSRVLYDALPGSRITIPQADALFHELAKGAGFGDVVNLRRATDKDADN